MEFLRHRSHTCIEIVNTSLHVRLSTNTKPLFAAREPRRQTDSKMICIEFVRQYSEICFQYLRHSTGIDKLAGWVAHVGCYGDDCQ